MNGRLAGAPISWGVCEVPGWGHQLQPDRVLAEMGKIGLAATEFGPDGFLPADPAARARLLAAHGLRAVGGFVPMVLHEPGHDPLSLVDSILDAFVTAGAEVLVLAAATGRDGYDGGSTVDNDGWRLLLRNLDRLAGRAAERGITAVLHPHVGTVVEGVADVWRVLDGSAVALCLDTGHLLIGGADPVRVAKEAPDRVAHVHLKDVDGAWAGRVRDGEVSYQAAVRAGMYRPLGGGDVDIPAIVSTLDNAGYRGWYVLEQDTVLDAEPAPGQGPAGDVWASLAFLDRLERR